MSMAMMLHELLEGWNGEVPAIPLTGISLDNRDIEPGNAFVAVQGQVGHGLDYARSAVAAGAVAVIHDGQAPLPQLDVPVAHVAVPVPSFAVGSFRLRERFPAYRT